MVSYCKKGSTIRLYSNPLKGDRLMVSIKKAINKYMTANGFVYDKTTQKYIHPEDIEESGTELTNNPDFVLDDTKQCYTAETWEEDMFTKVINYCLNNSGKEAYEKIANAQNKSQKAYLCGKKDTYKELIDFMMKELTTVESLEIEDDYNERN